MNQFSQADKKMQFDFLMGTIRKSKRFSPWLKEELPENIDIVKEYFGYSERKAREVVHLLSDSDIEEMSKYLYRGGKK